MSNLSPQNNRVIKTLKSGIVLDCTNAPALIGVGRLAARINELKDTYPIKKGWRSFYNKFGDKSRVRVYFITGE